MSISSADFNQPSPSGGCALHCTHDLPCGHICGQSWHAPGLHSAVPCLEPCSKAQIGCTHPCASPCGYPCVKKCTVNIYEEHPELKCEHFPSDLPCWQYQWIGSCRESVKKPVPGCGHEVTVDCCVDVAALQYKCSVICESLMSCGHTCNKQCHECFIQIVDGNIQLDHGFCQRSCVRKYSTCAHSCTAACHAGQACAPCNAPCEHGCPHLKCPLMCYEPCKPCDKKDCTSRCPHKSCLMPCAAPCTHVPCSKRCERSLACGHQCPSVCAERCPHPIYCQECAGPGVLNRPCDKAGDGKCYRDVDLNEDPCIFPPCGHFLTMRSMDFQMEMREFYTIVDGKPKELRGPLPPFSIEVGTKSCWTCNGPLSSIARYGRLTRRMLLDESVKRFNLQANQEYANLSEELSRQVRLIQQKKTSRPVQLEHLTPICGRRYSLMNVLKIIMLKADRDCWQALFELRGSIYDHRVRSETRENDYKHVANMIQSTRRDQETRGNAGIYDEIQETDCYLQALGLEMRVDNILIAELLTSVHLL